MKNEFNGSEGSIGFGWRITINIDAPRLHTDGLGFFLGGFFLSWKVE